MANQDSSFHEPLQKPGGEGWLYSQQQQKLCHFKPSMATVHAQWVEGRTFSWVPQGSPIPMTQRRMLRHNAIGLWRQCSRPAGFGQAYCPVILKLSQNFLG